MAKPKATNPVGRPSKYDPAYCERVREFLKDGYSVAAFAGEIGVAVSTVRLWIDEHPEFSDAVKTGQARATLWWENRARAVAMGEDGNPTTIIFGLKNRAPEDWRDKTEVDSTVKASVSMVEWQVVDPKTPRT